MPGCLEPRWEYGSEFHWLSTAESPREPLLSAEAVLYGTGRDALRALIGQGMAHRGWRRWFLPSYFCPEVTEAIVATGIEVLRYDDSPLRAAPPPLPTQPGDVVFVVNYFGLRGAEAVQALAGGAAEIVEDHTHDPGSPWARTSGADYCLASLRKTLPLPDGAALWSPQGHPLPEAPPLLPERQSAAWAKLSAMFLKRLYLDGEEVAKPVFRQLQLRGEAGLAAEAVSAPCLETQRWLPVLPWELWREIRRANHRRLSDSLSGIPGIEVLRPHAADACPFSVILQCQSAEQRQQLRSALLAEQVYPAVLWSMEETAHTVSAEAVSLSQRLLSLPCDFRYAAGDLERVAQLVRQVRSATARDEQAA